MKAFFKTTKAELIWRKTWHTWYQIELAIFEYINGFYNPHRKHSALGWKAPWQQLKGKRRSGTKAGQLQIADAQATYPTLGLLFADGGYAGDKLRAAMRRIDDPELEIARR